MDEIGQIAKHVFSSMSPTFRTFSFRPSGFSSTSSFFSLGSPSGAFLVGKWALGKLSEQSVYSLLNNL